MIAMKPYIQHLPIMKKMGLRLIVLLSGIFILGLQDANATHLVGGNLTYRCLGNNLYEIRLTVRRDCLTGAQNAQFDDPASIGFFDAVTNQLLSFPGVPDGQILVPLNNNDTLNISYGNPSLRPQLIHNFTLQNNFSRGKVFAGLTEQYSIRL